MADSFPLPIRDLRRVDSVRLDEVAVFDEPPLVFPDERLRVRRAGGPARRDLPRGLDYEVIAAGQVADLHVERRGRRSLLAVAVDVEPLVVRPFEYELLDRRRVAVEVEDDG